jgi:diacylglycerol kinase (ATP)
MKARLIYNPSAGMRTAREQLEDAAAELRKRGWIADIVETMRPGDTQRLAGEAAKEGLDAVIAVGGDGTVNEAANGLVGSATVLGVLPLGTANVWAKEMGMPLGDLQMGAKLIAESQVRTIDVGQVHGPTIDPRIFVLWCGVGLDAAITRDVEPQREMKRRWGALMFWIVGVRDAWYYRGQRATIVLDGKRLRRRVLLALAANVQLYGGIVRIAPSARLDDGLLDLLVFKGTGVGATALHLLRVFVGAHMHDPQVEVYPIKCVTIEGRNLPVHVDAEPVGFTPVEIQVRPRALRVLVPKTANQELFACDQ